MQEKMKPDRAQVPLRLKIISPTNTIGITDRALEMGQGQGAKLLGKSRKLHNSPFRLIKYGFSFKSSLEDLIGPQIQCLFLSHFLPLILSPPPQHSKSMSKPGQYYYQSMEFQGLNSKQLQW